MAVRHCLAASAVPRRFRVLCLLSVLAACWTALAPATSAQLRNFERFKEHWEPLSGNRENRIRAMASNQHNRDAAKDRRGPSFARLRRPSPHRSASSQPWVPIDPSRPLPIHHVIDHPFPGYSGLNNILWSHAFALRDGCQAAKNHTMASATAGHHKSAGGPLSFAVVVLPNLMPSVNSRDPMETLKQQHHYSDIFDISTLAQVAVEELGCFVTDLSTLTSLASRRLVVLAPPDRLTFSQADGRVKGGHFLGLLYGGLAPSERLHGHWIAPCMAKMAAKFGDGSGFVAVHARVEDDWLANGDCERKEVRENGLQPRLPHPIRYCFKAQEIADIVVRTVGPPAGHNVLVNYAANLLHARGSTAKEVKPSLQTEDPMSVWPSNWTVTSPSVLKCLEQSQAPGDRLTYTKQAAVSFFLAAKAASFVGPMRSTMSKGIAKHRFHLHEQCKGGGCEQMGDMLNNFAYDCGMETGYERANRMFFGPQSNCPAGSCCL